jgi:hypothetical protein
VWRIRDVYPGPIPDQKTAIKDIDGKTCVVIHFFRGIKFTKLNYFIFEMLKKKKLCKFSNNYRNFYTKNYLYALKNMGLGPGIRDPG